ncbi:hypothetical protein EVAR_86422_1 [Eumeta japonica]|uniref:Uncharacterized protein n=1 Tax=Eumeta variegata TaxID=151549 RepID=A0A4C1Z752_EUMVA|nr:hypothetical protein EVAR_86422_1 [Eumeta japonica]
MIQTFVRGSTRAIVERIRYLCPMVIDNDNAQEKFKFNVGSGSGIQSSTGIAIKSAREKSGSWLSNDVKYEKNRCMFTEAES